MLLIKVKILITQEINTKVNLVGKIGVYYRLHTVSFP